MSMLELWEMKGADLIRDLTPEDKGEYYLVKCPKCGRREAFVYKNNPSIRCNRVSNCGYSATIWDYLELDKSRYIEMLKAAGIADDFTPRDNENQAEKALAHFQAALFKPEGKSGLDYLTKRGYSEAEIKRMGLGYFSPAGINIQELGVAHIPAETHKIIIAARDIRGAISGWTVRRIDGESEKKYINSTGSIDYIFNLNNAKRERDIVLVEGYLDALIAEAKGIKGVIAVGTNSLTLKQFETLKQSRITARITLALDADERAGKDGTYKTIQRLNELKVEAFVLTYPNGYKDLDELLRNENGLELFEKARAEAVSGAKWTAQYLSEKIGTQTDRQKSDYIREALVFQMGLSPIEKGVFTNEIADRIGILPIDLEKEIERHTAEREREHRERRQRTLLKDFSRAIDTGTPAERVEIIDELRGLESEPTRKRILKTYDEHIETIRTKREGLATGYDKIDNLLSIPSGAITIIAARPRHGKTTLLINLCLNMIRTHTSKKFLYMSYEEGAEDVFTKMLMNESEETIHPEANFLQYQYYLRGGNVDREKIEQGKQKLREYFTSGRLAISDEPLHSGKLYPFLSSLEGLDGVFIDYIQKIPANPQSKTYSRQTELQKISADILHAAITLSIPVIIGAQLGRPKNGDLKRENTLLLENLREAGDIEQDANIVLGVWNEAAEKEEAVGVLELEILKNRNGKPSGTIDLNINSAIMRIDNNGYL